MLRWLLSLVWPQSEGDDRPNCLRVAEEALKSGSHVVVVSKHDLRDAVEYMRRHKRIIVTDDQTGGVVYEGVTLLGR